MTEISPELKLPMARETYFAYVSAHPRLKNSRHAMHCVPDTRKDFKHFLGVVDKCEAQGVDPVEYVVGVMGKYMRGDPADVIARDLNNSARISAYVSALSEAEASEVSQWQELEHRLGAIVAGKVGDAADIAAIRTAIENELCSTRRHYEDWFRVLYLDPMSDAIADVYGETAAAELLRRRSLRVFVMRMRPESYTRFMTKCGLQHVLAYDEDHL